jgi:hypothetical protein
MMVFFVLFDVWRMKLFSEHVKASWQPALIGEAKEERVDLMLLFVMLAFVFVAAIGGSLARRR